MSMGGLCFSSAIFTPLSSDYDDGKAGRAVRGEGDDLLCF